MKAEAVFQPQIVAFVCKWCTYSGADAAGLSRLSYPANVRVIMLPCSGRIDIKFVLRAFAQGANGVLVSGCHLGDCHYSEGNYRANRRWTLLRDLWETMGFDLRRLKCTWISAAEGHKWAQTIRDFTEELRQLGPDTILRELCTFQNALPAPESLTPELEIYRNLKDSSVLAEAIPAPSALIRAIRENLANGSIQAVAGWLRRPRTSHAYPAWLHHAEELERLIAPPPAGDITRLLKDAASLPGEKVGIIARPREIASLGVLAQEHALNRDSFLVFVLDEQGHYRDTCTLANSWPQVVRNLAPSVPVGFTKKTLTELQEFRQLPREKRQSFWHHAAQSCLRCYACRQVCPLCRCSTCYAEKNQPQWFPTAATGMGNFAWLTLRALHLAGRCTGCGACQDACPVGLPLNLLNATLAQSALDKFAYRAGLDPDRPPLQAEVKEEGKEAFSMCSDILS